MGKVDKQDGQSTIKVKINGEEPKSQQEVAVHDWEIVDQEVAAAADEKQDDESFDWVLPEIDEIEVKEFKPNYYAPVTEKKKFQFQFKRPSKGYGLTVVISAIIAIFVGVFFGFSILKFIVSEEDHLSSRATGAASGTSSVASNAAASLPSLKFGVVQAGVFNSKDTAQTVLDQLDQKNLPSALVPLDGQDYIFIGITSNTTDASALAAKYKKKNVDVYVKELTLSSSQLQNLTKDEQTFTTLTTSLFQSLSSEVSNGILTGQISSTNMKSIEANVKKLNALVQIKQTKLVNLKKDQLSCYQSLLNFQKNKQTSDLVKAEQSMLSYIQTYSSK